MKNKPEFVVDKQMFDQTDGFIKAMDQLRVRPGDWHAGLTMLQSINNIFWDGLLQPIAKKLGWNRVTQDCRDCYFQASR